MRARIAGVNEVDLRTASSIDALALELTRAAGGFARTVGRVPGSRHSTIVWRVLIELEHSGPSRVSDLAHQQRVAQPTMTGLVQRLEGEGWVERGPDPHDGRATLVAVTEAGSAGLEEYRRAAADRVGPHLARLSDFDRATLARAAELMLQLHEGIIDD